MSLTLPILATGLEIVTSSGEEVGVRSGELLELSCEADVEYRWCYWEHDGIKYTAKSVCSCLDFMIITGTAPHTMVRQMSQRCSGGRNLHTNVASSSMQLLRF